MLAQLAALLLFASQLPQEGDSVATLRQARRAQAEFEGRRLMLLPEVHADGGPCDARIGRFCYWVDEGSTPPPEPERIAQLRERFLTQLTTLSTASPRDAWIAAQYVRYLVEAGHHASALAAAKNCRASAQWCASLAVLALHSAGDVRGADSAVSVALGAMSEAERCEAHDLSPIVGSSLRQRFKVASCAERDTLAARWWWLAQPFYSADGNEFRTEWFARRVFARLATESRSAYAMKGGKDLSDMILRYGWPIAWGRTPQRAGALPGDGAVGYDATPSFALAPRDAALDDLASVGDDTYDLDDEKAASRFAPRGIKAIGRLRRQLSLFRRGDSTLVIAAFNAAGDTALATGAAPLPSLVVMRDPRTPAITVRGDVARHGVMLATVPWRPGLVALELVDTAGRRAARARDGVRSHPDSGARVGLSDLLLFVARDTVTGTTLDSVAANALTDRRIGRDGPLGLFWEMYGLRAAERVTASIGLVPASAGWLRRIAERAHVIEERSTVRLQWTDAPEVRGSVGGRTLVIDLTGVPAGEYTIELLLTVEGQPPLRAASRVEIVSP